MNGPADDLATLEAMLAAASTAEGLELRALYLAHARMAMVRADERLDHARLVLRDAEAELARITGARPPEASP